MMAEFRRSLTVLSVSLLATACGRKGPLIYPDMLLPAAPSAISVQQSGAAMRLELVIPGKDRGGRSLKNSVIGLKVSRRYTEKGQKEACSLCAADYGYLQTVYLDRLQNNTQRFSDRLILLDSDVNSGGSYSYGIVPFIEGGIEGALFTTKEVPVNAPVPAPVLKVDSSPTEVKLYFSAPPLDYGTLVGFNLYRTSVTNGKSFQPYNRETVKGNAYVDTTLERGVRYRYSVRALVMLSPDNMVESIESDEVIGMLKEDE